MPIRKEHRHLYRGPAWRALRGRILTRAGDCCERCGVPDRQTVLRAFGWWTPGSVQAIVFKSNTDSRTFIELPWRHAGVPTRTAAFLATACRWVYIVLTISHLNHDPTDNRDENLAALCQWCHLRHDRDLHVLNSWRTRTAKKDAQRPLLRVAEPA